MTTEAPTYTTTWADLHAYCEANGKLVKVRGDHPVFGDSEWLASTMGLHRYDGNGAETAMWQPEAQDVLTVPIPIPPAGRPFQAEPDDPRQVIAQSLARLAGRADIAPADWTRAGKLVRDLKAAGMLRTARERKAKACSGPWTEPTNRAVRREAKKKP